jgi:hypothetical protein
MKSPNDIGVSERAFGRESPARPRRGAASFNKVTGAKVAGACGFMRVALSRFPNCRSGAYRHFAQFHRWLHTHMLAFHVHLNGKKVCIAGVPGTGVLSAHVTWVRRTGTKEELTMDVGGLITPTDEYVRRTYGRPVRVGDEVRIKIVEADRVDRPSSRKRSDPAEGVRRQKRYVREVAKRFGWKIQTQK